jgi:hypothetical protein
MLAGLMSRWMILCLCAASSASAIWIATSKSSAAVRRLLPILSLSVSPSRNSIAMNGWPSCSSMSNTVQMFW